jgi:hypothetical protein
MMWPGFNIHLFENNVYVEELLRLLYRQILNLRPLVLSCI